MDSLAVKLDSKLMEWEPGTVDEVRRMIEEIIELADSGDLDIMKSRSVEQEVMNLIDEP